MEKEGDSLKRSNRLFRTSSTKRVSEVEGAVSASNDKCDRGEGVRVAGGAGCGKRVRAERIVIVFIRRGGIYPERPFAPIRPLVIIIWSSPSSFSPATDTGTASSFFAVRNQIEAANNIRKIK